MSLLRRIGRCGLAEGWYGLVGMSLGVDFKVSETQTRPSGFLFVLFVLLTLQVLLVLISEHKDLQNTCY